MSTSKINALRDLSFGQRVAEEEIAELSRYFVETDQWRRLFAGEIDIVYGLKGSGKSALYTTLLDKSSELETKRILLIAGENPRGTPVFKDLVEDPPTSQAEFRGLWKLYFLQLLGERFREEQFDSSEARDLVLRLEESNLLPRGGGLKAFVRTALDYVRQFRTVESLSSTLEVDAASGLPSGVTGKISFREPSAAGRTHGVISVDSLFSLADEALARHDYSVWILLDRLDVAFAEQVDLEKNALRALFVVYSDLRTLERIRQKIFLRSDIWERITSEGFREASHIVKTITIDWNQRSLMNLMVRRILQSRFMCEFYSVSPSTVLSDIDEQERLFYRIFPAQVDVGSRRPTTFDWLQTRTQDGTRHTAPRELIHLLSEARGIQLRDLELGSSFPDGEQLIAGHTLKRALEEVSKVRLQQTLFAEFPTLRPYVEKLRGGKAQHSLETLVDIWKERKERTEEIAQSLVEIGFFERRGSRDYPDYWIPFLYRDALGLTQGAAE